MNHVSPKEDEKEKHTEVRKTKTKKKSTRKKRKYSAKPEHREMEKKVMEMFDAQDINYHEWLYEKHKEYLVELTLNNDKIIDVLKGEDD